MTIPEIKDKITKEEKLCAKHHSKINRLKIQLRNICQHNNIKYNELVYTSYDGEWRGGTAECLDCGLYGSADLSKDRYEYLEKLYLNRQWEN